MQTLSSSNAYKPPIPMLEQGNATAETAGLTGNDLAAAAEEAETAPKPMMSLKEPTLVFQEQHKLHVESDMVALQRKESNLLVETEAENPDRNESVSIDHAGPKGSSIQQVPNVEQQTAPQATRQRLVPFASHTSVAPTSECEVRGNLAFDWDTRGPYGVLKKKGYGAELIFDRLKFLPGQLRDAPVDCSQELHVGDPEVESESEDDADDVDPVTALLRKWTTVDV